jgi:hypothetical protein
MIETIQGIITTVSEALVSVFESIVGSINAGGAEGGAE